MTEDDIIERLKENVIQGRKNQNEEGIDEKLSGTLGVVELTIALHYVFNTPYDRLVWDVGH